MSDKEKSRGLTGATLLPNGKLKFLFLLGRLVCFRRPSCEYLYGMRQHFVADGRAGQIPNYCHSAIYHNQLLQFYISVFFQSFCAGGFIIIMVPARVLCHCPLWFLGRGAWTASDEVVSAPIPPPRRAATAQERLLLSTDSSQSSPEEDGHLSQSDEDSSSAAAAKRGRSGRGVFVGEAERRRRLVLASDHGDLEPPAVREILLPGVPPPQTPPSRHSPRLGLPAGDFGPDPFGGDDAPPALAPPLAAPPLKFLGEDPQSSTSSQLASTADADRTLTHLSWTTSNDRTFTHLSGGFLEAGRTLTRLSDSSEEDVPGSCSDRSAGGPSPPPMLIKVRKTRSGQGDVYLTKEEVGRYEEDLSSTTSYFPAFSGEEDDGYRSDGACSACSFMAGVVVPAADAGEFCSEGEQEQASSSFANTSDTIPSEAGSASSSRAPSRAASPSHVARGLSPVCSGIATDAKPPLPPGTPRGSHPEWWADLKNKDWELRGLAVRKLVSDHLTLVSGKSRRGSSRGNRRVAPPPVDRIRKRAKPLVEALVKLLQDEPPIKVQHEVVVSLGKLADKMPDEELGEMQKNRSMRRILVALFYALFPGLQNPLEPNYGEDHDPSSSSHEDRPLPQEQSSGTNLVSPAELANALVGTLARVYHMSNEEDVLQALVSFLGSDVEHFPNLTEAFKARCLHAWTHVASPDDAEVFVALAAIARRRDDDGQMNPRSIPLRSAAIRNMEKAAEISEDWRQWLVHELSQLLNDEEEDKAILAVVVEAFGRIPVHDATEETRFLDKICRVFGRNPNPVGFRPAYPEVCLPLVKAFGQIVHRGTLTKNMLENICEVCLAHQHSKVREETKRAIVTIARKPECNPATFAEITNVLREYCAGGRREYVREAAATTLRIILRGSSGSDPSTRMALEQGSEGPAEQGSDSSDGSTLHEVEDRSVG